MASFAARSPAKVATPRRKESTPVSPVPSEIQIPPEEIAKRAFEKYVARGYTDGFHERDWFDAEDELKAEYRERQ